MSTASPLQPTLWRSCRVLANRRRLRILELLADDSELTVTAVAQQLPLPMPVASQYLRALEARGLLQAHRRGRHVSYRLSPPRNPTRLQPVVDALRDGFRHHPGFAEQAFRWATAFTHPRRIALYRAVRTGHHTPERLRAATGISRFALARHLAKLAARGFIRRRGERGWELATPQEAFPRALACLTGG